MAAPNQTYQSIRHLMSILLDDVAGNKLLVQMVTSLVSSLGDRIQAFRTPEGYAPQNIGELTMLLDVLFAESLHELSATSIHSSHPTLKSYKGYWEDPELGVLPAPRDRNLRDGELRTVIMTKHETVRGYTNTFVDLVACKVVLRNMRRLDTGERISRPRQFPAHRSPADQARITGERRGSLPAGAPAAHRGRRPGPAAARVHR
jgi:hypothetical protein